MMGLYLKKNSKMLIKSRLSVRYRTSGDLFLPQIQFWFGKRVHSTWKQDKTSIR